MTVFKKIRFLARFLTAVVKKQLRTVLLGLLLGAVFFIILPRILKVLPKFRRTEKIGLIGQYEISNLPDEVLQEISYGLTAVSAKGEAQPFIAENWEISSDGKTYTFKINPEPRTWHDGKPFSLADVNYNFKDVSVQVSGGSLVFNLKDPFSPFPAILSRPLFKKGLVGLGKYRVKKIEKNNKYVKSILLTPYGQSSLFSGDENSALPNRLYRFYNNEKDLKTAFNLGEINFAQNLSGLEGLALSPAIKTSEIVREDAYLAVYLNTEKPLFQDKTFRQALAYSLSKGSDARRAFGPISPGSWAYNPDVKPYAQDLAHAKQLLAGEKSTQKAKVTISAFPQYESEAQAVKTGLGQLGVDSDIQITTFIPEDFDILLLAREIPQDPDQYYFWHSTQAGNIANFKSPRIDKLLEDGRQFSSREERKNIYFDFQRFLAEESPVIFLSHPVSYTVRRD